MQRNSNGRFFPLLIIIIIVILLIVGVVAVGRAIFQGGDSTDKSALVTSDSDGLLNTSASRSVSLTVRGPIVADEKFTSYAVVISPTKRSMDVYNGYLDQRTGGTSLDNNHAAYEQFVYALDKANMMKGDAEETKSDLRGICATGYVYEYAVLDSGKEAKRLWTSTCGGSKGTLDASKDQLSSLFLVQIPASDDLIPFKQGPSLRL